MTNDTSQITPVMETLNIYRDATFNGSVEMLRQIFHAKASISGWVVTPTSPNGALMCDSMEVLYGMISPEEAPAQTKEPFRFHVDSLDVHGDMACAKVIEENLDGGNYANYLQLHKVDGRWLITSKAFYHY